MAGRARIFHHARNRLRDSTLPHTSRVVRRKRKCPLTWRAESTSIETWWRQTSEFETAPTRPTAFLEHVEREADFIDAVEPPSRAVLVVADCTGDVSSTWLVRIAFAQSCAAPSCFESKITIAEVYQPLPATNCKR